MKKSRPCRRAVNPAVALTCIACIVCVSLAGCDQAGQAGANAPLTTTRDSAGITIVEGPGYGTESLPEWQPAEEPSLVIGGLGGPEMQQLYRVNDALRLSDGRIAIANTGTSEIRLFAADGTFVQAVGGEGDGPGEFRYIERMDRSPDDSLFVWDMRSMRVSVFDPAGGFVRSFGLEPPAEQAFPRYTAGFDHGLLVRVSTIGGSGPPRSHTVREFDIAYVRYDARGRPLDTLAVLSTAPHFMVQHGSGPRLVFTMFAIPFTAGGSWAVDGDQFHEGTGDAYEIRTRDSTGTVRRIVRRDVDPIPVTDELMARWQREISGDTTGDQEWDEIVRDDNASMPIPDTVALFDALAVDAAGDLWVRRTPLPGDTMHTWDVFDPDGFPLARARLPAALQVFELGTNYVLGRRSDELDVERVVLYPLLKP